MKIEKLIEIAEERFQIEDLRESTRISQARRIRASIKWLSDIGVTDIEQINTLLLAKYRDDLIAKQTSSQTIISYVSNLHTLLRYCASAGHTETMPAIPKLHRISRALEYLEIEQVQALMNQARLSKYSNCLPWMAVGFYAGLRTSEIFHLEWQAVRFGSSPYLIVRDTPWGRTKTSSERVVPMSISLVSILKPMRAQTGYVVPTETPRPKHSTLLCRFGRHLKYISREANLKATVYPHLMRKTFGAHCLISGMSLYQVSQLLGHKSTSTTENYYGAVLNQHIQIPDIYGTGKK